MSRWVVRVRLSSILAILVGIIAIGLLPWLSSPELLLGSETYADGLLYGGTYIFVFLSVVGGSLIFVAGLGNAVR